jgi:hypothetical protein
VKYSTYILLLLLPGFLLLSSHCTVAVASARIPAIVVLLQMLPGFLLVMYHCCCCCQVSCYCYILGNLSIYLFFNRKVVLLEL